jgi:hypothetical protein
VVFEALSHPDLDPTRPWLHLLDDELPPRILESVDPRPVTWSSSWRKLSGARIRYDLSACGQETDLRWTLLALERVSDQGLLGHLRKRMNQLINADLRSRSGSSREDAAVAFDGAGGGDVVGQARDQDAVRCRSAIPRSTGPSSTIHRREAWGSAGQGVPAGWASRVRLWTTFSDRA